MSIVEVGNSNWASRGKAPISFVVRIRFADDSPVVWIEIIDCPWGIEEDVAIYPISVSMDLVGPGLELILGYTLAKAILRREGALQHGKLLDHVKWRIDEVLAALKFGEGDWYAVKHHFVLKVQSAVDTTISRYTGRQSAAKACRRRDSWCRCTISHSDKRYPRR